MLRLPTANLMMARQRVLCRRDKQNATEGTNRALFAADVLAVGVLLTAEALVAADILSALVFYLQLAAEQICSQSAAAEVILTGFSRIFPV